MSGHDQANPSFTFGDWTVEPALNRLTNGELTEHVERLTMDVLAYLLDHPGLVVSSDELLSALWGDRHGDPGMVQKRIAQLRQVLGDDSRHPRYIETVRKRGYRVIAPVSKDPTTTDQSPVAQWAPWAVPLQKTPSWRSYAVLSLAVALIAVGGWWTYLQREALPDAVLEAGSATEAASRAHSIAVLPFDNLSGDPEQDYVVDGMTDAVISRLAMNRGLHVIARNSTFIYRGRSVDVRQVGQDLGVAYVLEGSVQRAGDRIRINAQLIDAHTGTHLWTDTYDRRSDDPFGLQDDIATRVAAALLKEHKREEISRARRVPTEDLTAYDAFLRGQYDILRWARESDSALILTAREQFETAVRLDPTFADARARLALTYWFGALDRLHPARDALSQAEQLAQEALAHDGESAWAYATLAIVYAQWGQHAQALTAADNAIDLMPSDASSHLIKGYVLFALGRYRESVSHLERVLELDPADPGVWPLVHLGASRTALGDFAGAESALKECIARYPEHQAGYRELAVMYLQSWQMQQEADSDALDQALAMARRAVELPNAPTDQGLRLRWVLYVRGERDYSVDELTSSTGPAAHTAVAFNAIGRPDLALKALESNDPAGSPMTGLSEYAHLRATAVIERSASYHLTGRPEQALATLALALELPLNVQQAFQVHVLSAILHGEVGNLMQARASATDILKLSPNFSVETWGERNPRRDEAQIQRDMAALRKAGLK